MKKVPLLALLALVSVAGLVLLARVGHWGPWKFGRDDVAAVQPSAISTMDDASPGTGTPSEPAARASERQGADGKKPAPTEDAEADNDEGFPGGWLRSVMKGRAPEPEPVQSTDIAADNAAHYFLLAAELLTDATVERIAALMELVRAGVAIDPAELAECVEQCGDSLAALRAGLDMKNCQMPEVRGGEYMPYLRKFGALAKLMDLQALNAIQQGDSDAACRAWSELLQFSNDTTRGAGLDIRISSNAMFDTASYDIRAAVMAGSISSAQLAAFLRAAEATESQRVPFSEVMAADGSVTAWYESLLSDPEHFRDIMMQPEYSPNRERAMAMAAVSRDELPRQLSEAVQAYRTCSELAAMPHCEFMRLYQELPASQNLFAQWLLEQIQPAPAAEARSDVLRGGTLLVCALQLHHDQHGQWPENLDALAPGFLNQVPQDPFTGEALKYQVRPDGILLYSVGANMQDDGGIPGKGTAMEGDLIIWPVTQ